MDPDGCGGDTPTVAADEPSPLHRPERLTPQLLDVPGADPQFVELGRRYWAWQGLDRASGSAGAFPPSSIWAESTTKIAADTGESVSRLYILAAAGVTATLPDVECPTCAAPIVLKSRQALDVIARGEDPAGQCARCSGTLLKAVAKLRDPATVERRRARREREQAERMAAEAARDVRRRIEDARRAWQSACRNVLAEIWPLHVAGPDGTVDEDSLAASLRTEISTLAMLSYAPDAVPLPAVDFWPFPLAPGALRHELLVAVLRSGLLRVHPTASPLEAFAWELNFEQAYAAAGDDVAALPVPVSERLFPSRVAWYAWQGASIGTSPAVLSKHLIARIERWLRTEQGQDDLLELVGDVLVAEGRRYFDDQLAYHGLPDVPDNHEDRLTEVFTRAAAELSLGQIYNLVWRAVRSGAAAAQATRAPLANMTTHAVNRLEDSVRRASAEAWELKPFTELRDLPLTALTRTIFTRLLNADPMTTTAPTVRAGLPAATSHTLARHAPAQNDDWAEADRFHALEQLRAQLPLDLQRLTTEPANADRLRGALEDDLETWFDDLEVVETDRPVLRDAFARLAVVAASLRGVLDDRRSVLLATIATAAAFPGEVELRIGEDDGTYPESVALLVKQRLLTAVLTDD